MGLLKEIWLTQLRDSILSLVLIIIVILLVVGILYLAIKELIFLFTKKKKQDEIKEIFKIKGKQKELIKKLKKEKKQIDMKLSKLKEYKLKHRDGIEVITR
jgi:biopolymer transport protein ExbB/TolQ